MDKALDANRLPRDLDLGGWRPGPARIDRRDLARGAAKNDPPGDAASAARSAWPLLGTIAATWLTMLVAILWAAWTF